MERYLENVYELCMSGGSTRLSDIALRMNVTKASANNAMNVLSKLGLVENERYREIRLTPEGKHLAIVLANKHSILCQLFTDVIGIDPEVADADACAIEHVISPEAIEQIDEFLRRN